MEERRVCRAIAASLGAIVGLAAWPVSASADETGAVPQSVAVDLDRLGAELDLFTAAATRTRWVNAMTGLSLGSVLVPVGVVLLNRTDGISQALVVGMIVGGSAQLISVPIALLPTRMGSIRDRYRSRRSATGDTAATVLAIENEWRHAASVSWHRRVVVGTTMLIVGAVTLAAGLGMLLAPSGILGMDREAQYTWGGVFMGFGMSAFPLGVRFILEWSLEETSWEAYQAMKTGGARAGARPISLGVGVSPMRDGALAFATLVF